MTDLPITESPMFSEATGAVAASGEPPEFPPPEAAEPGGGLSIPPLRARHVYLRPITPSDYPFLQMLETVGDLAPRWRHRGVTHSPEQWVGTLWSDVLAQFMVVTTSTNKPIGRVLVYHPNFQDRNAYFAAMRFDLTDRSPLMMYGIALFLRYVFTNWDLEKLYMEVPEYNYEQFASGYQRFFEIEGRMRGHLRTGARSWDQLILAIYRQQADRESARVRLDFAARSALSTDRAPGTQPWQTISWETFVGEAAVIAGVAPETITRETRVLEDLALDSLALAELGVVLVDRYDVYSLSRDLETRAWDNVKLRDLFDEYLTGAPVSRPEPGTGSL